MPNEIRITQILLALFRRDLEAMTKYSVFGHELIHAAYFIVTDRNTQESYIVSARKLKS